MHFHKNNVLNAVCGLVEPLDVNPFTMSLAVSNRSILQSLYKSIVLKKK
jgi:hypothetical protein